MFSDEFLNEVASGNPVYGVSATLAGIDPVTVTSRLSTDWIELDTEHASYDIQEVRKMIAVIPEDTAALVRISGADSKEVERVLDVGADGIIMPNLRTVEQVQAFVDSAYYPPKGDRSVADSFTSDFRSDRSQEYLQQANEKVFVIVQVETALAAQIEKIAQIDGIDCLLVEPADLSSQLGNPMLTDTLEYHEVVSQTLEACKQNNVAPGYRVKTNDIQPFIENGWQVLSLGTNAELLASEVQRRLNRIS